MGLNAAKIALGMGAQVTILDSNLPRLRYLDDIFLGRVATLASNSVTIAQSIRKSDLLIGAVLIPGASAPKLVTSEMVSSMKKGAVIVDVSVDQGVALKQLILLPTASQPFSWTVYSITVWLICQGRYLGLPRLH